MVLVLVAYGLKLGGAAIAGEEDARRRAEADHIGFSAEGAIVSRGGSAALVRGQDGTFVLLKVHGAQVASRRLAPPLQVEPDGEGISIATGERMFGKVRLKLDSASRDKLRGMV